MICRSQVPKPGAISSRDSKGRGRNCTNPSTRLLPDLRGPAEDVVLKNGKIAPAMKPLARYMEETGTTLDQLIAAALGISVDEISWGHAVPVQHLRGNGPQTGRAT